MEQNNPLKLGLTPIQLKCFKTIETFIEKHSYSPTVREIANLMEMSGSGNVHRLVKELERRGWIRKWPRMRRSIQII